MTAAAWVWAASLVARAVLVLLGMAVFDGVEFVEEVGGPWTAIEFMIFAISSVEEDRACCC